MDKLLPFAEQAECLQCGSTNHKINYRAADKKIDEEHLLFSCAVCGYETRRQTRRSQHPHPDDFMIINIEMAWRAKVNPDAKNPPPIEGIMETSICLPAEPETADYLEQIAKAIRERRLYGFLQQDMAETSVGCGDWIEKPVQEIFAEMQQQEQAEQAVGGSVVKLSERHKPKGDDDA